MHHGWSDDDESGLERGQGERGGHDERRSYLPGHPSLFRLEQRDLRVEGAKQLQNAGITIEHAAEGKSMRVRHVVIIG